MANDVPPTEWPSDRALLFVHGVGNAKPGAYDALVAQVKAILGADAARFAIYFFYYDQYNEWFAQKQQATVAFTKAVQKVGDLVHAFPTPTKSADLGNVASAFAGDVIWPVLLADARRSIRTALLMQLQQIRKDGIAAGHLPRRQHVSIMAHSMGCFHVYEALSHAAVTPSELLTPGADESVFDNVILMASPVQLIRTVGTALGALVPQRESIYSIGSPLAIPSSPGGDEKPVFCTPNLVSITGNLDPVGGYFFRHPYAYMTIPGQTAFVDQQQVATVGGDSEEVTLTNVFKSALQNAGPPTIAPTNPHDWGTYVAKHENDLRTWLA
jgi:hypothetical protein